MSGTRKGRTPVLEESPATPASAAASEGAGGKEQEREQRLAERGDRILDALATLIARWGYGKTTVDDIAREAGVAKGTVYLHWPSKGAMLHALIAREERQWNAVVAAHIATDPRGGTLSSLYRHSLALCFENPLLRALLTGDHDALGEWTRSPQSRERARERMAAGYALMQGMREAGLVRTDLPIDAQVYLLSAMTYGIMTLNDYMPAEFVPPVTDILDGFAAIVQRGFEADHRGATDAQALAEGRGAIAELMARLANVSAPSDAATNGQGGANSREHGRAHADAEGIE